MIFQMHWTEVYDFLLSSGLTSDEVLFAIEKYKVEKRKMEEMAERHKKSQTWKETQIPLFQWESDGL